MKRITKEDRRNSKLAVDGFEPLADEGLLLEYRRTGSEAVFAALVRRYERELFNYLRRYLGSTAMAEDAFQGTFLQVHLKCESFEEGRRFRPWLYTIATNQAIDLQRRNKRHRHVSLNRRNRDEASDLGVLMDLLVGEEREPGERFDLRERAEWIRAEVEQLPEPLRTSVELVYFRGLKYREAADELGIPVGTVKSRLHSALGKLREAWLAVYSPASAIP
jgi:RNA polymerase sigma-70 factor (ECF subfamily)